MCAHSTCSHSTWYRNGRRFQIWVGRMSWRPSCLTSVESDLIRWCGAPCPCPRPRSRTRLLCLRAPAWARARLPLRPLGRRSRGRARHHMQAERRAPKPHQPCHRPRVLAARGRCGLPPRKPPAPDARFWSTGRLFLWPRGVRTTAPNPVYVVLRRRCSVGYAMHHGVPWKADGPRRAGVCPSRRTGVSRLCLPLSGSAAAAGPQTPPTQPPSWLRPPRMRPEGSMLDLDLVNLP